MIGWLKSLIGFPRVAETGRGSARSAEATYDIARTTNGNVRHWQNADNLSAKAANSIDVRRIIRSRARYECANNAYADGIATTLANDVIGKGATLQVNSESESFNATVEDWWGRWVEEIDLWEKLRLARRSKAIDGEAFLVLIYDPTLQSPVKWNVEVIECDRIHTPFMPFEDPLRTDGIIYDHFGHPLEYHLLRQHPGDFNAVGAWEYDAIPAKFILHWFTKKRPGELRGVSEYRASLRPLADLRRFIQATVGKRELQARNAGFLKQGASPDVDATEEELSGLTPFMEIDIPRDNYYQALPDGVEPVQFDTPSGDDPFSPVAKQCLSEAGRPWCMNYVVVACDSSDASFSAGKLDHRLYGRNTELEQSHCGSKIVARLFSFWMFVARTSPAQIIPDDSLLDWSASVEWESFDDPDPETTANADASDIDAGIVSRTTVQIRRRLDPAQEEQRMARERGMTVDEFRLHRRELDIKPIAPRITSNASAPPAAQRTPAMA